MLEKDIQLIMDTTPDKTAGGGKLNAGVTCQRAKTTHAGDMLYVASYPIWDTQHQTQARAAAEAVKRTRSGEAQRKLNARNAQRRLEQLINANFGAGDLLVTCTYANDEQPDSDEAAHRDMINMMARLKRLYKRQGLPPPKYIYVTETTESVKNGVRYHHHLMLQGGISREAVEEAWARGHRGHCNTRRARPEREGLTGWAKYITKQVNGTSRQGIGTRRKWCASKNLTQPITTTADKKISRKRVERIAAEADREPVKARAALESCYPGYEVIDMTVRASSYVSGAYIYAMLARRRE